MSFDDVVEDSPQYARHEHLFTAVYTSTTRFSTITYRTPVRNIQRPSARRVYDSFLFFFRIRITMYRTHAPKNLQAKKPSSQQIYRLYISYIYCCCTRTRKRYDILLQTVSTASSTRLCPSCKYTVNCWGNKNIYNFTAKLRAHECIMRPVIRVS